MCYKKIINLCQHANMYEHVIVETLSGTFNAIFFFFFGGGGGVTYIALPFSEDLHLLFCVLCKCSSRKS